MSRRDSLKVMVAHSGWQHSPHLALALNKCSMLDLFVTTVYDHPKSRVIRILKKFGAKAVVQGFGSRHIDGIEASKVLPIYSISGLISILCSRMKWNKLYELNERQLNWRFGRRVARLAVQRNIDVLVMYENKAADAFSYLKKRRPNIVRVIDSASACSIYVDSYLREEALKVNSNNTFFESLFERRDSFTSTTSRELELADGYLVASKYVQMTLSWSGYPADKVIVCGYGGNFQILAHPKKLESCGPLKLVYCGRCTPEKGIHYLITAVENKSVSLTLVGDPFEVDSLLAEHGDVASCIKLAGKVSHDEVVHYLDEADVFVFPSLSDGMSLACIEALCRGLPVICTDHTGVCDYIEDSVNGFVVPTSDPGALSNAIEWFIENRELIPRMSQAAIETARQLSWERYENQIAEEFNRIY